MPSHHSTAETDLLRAFRSYETQQRIINTRVGSLLVVFLMPAGSMLDYFVYREKLVPFFYIRLITSAIAAGIFGFLFTDSGRKCGKWLGVIVPLLPVVGIAGMIVVKEGFASPYYAGLNLVLLAVGTVLHWRLMESILATGLVLFIYIAAGLLHGAIPPTSVIFNNFYFLLLMDVIVVVGTYFQEKQRFREFGLRYQLESSRKALEETNRQLRELDELKSRFFANISHELRTPLTLLIAPLESIIQRVDFRFDEETRMILSTMHVNAMRLLKLINDLLELVRLESGRTVVRAEPVEIPGLLRGLASAAREVARQKKLRLDVIVDPAVQTAVVDRDKIEKVLLNLQFNAIKFTPDGGSIELRARRDGSDLVLEVHDTGVGIAADKLPQVFNRFFQADDSAQRKFQGVGIGLALVKELSEAMGGSVAVQSELGRGSIFTVRLPCVEAPVAAEALSQDSADAEDNKEQWLVNLYRRAELVPAVAAQQAMPVPEPVTLDENRPLILVADDEPDMRRFLARRIAGKYRVAEADDGLQALEMALHLHPNLILLDMMMPEKDGLQVCRELREHKETQTTPIIMLTARADEQTKLSALSAGANDYLTKPFVTAELEARVRNLIATSEYQDKLSAQNTVLSDALKRLKDAESELVQSEKLASLGRLSAGIIHEINNPLNFATTGLFTLRGKARHLAPEQQAEYAEILHDVEEGLTRVKTIVSDLRAFAHRENSAIEPIDVTEAVQSTLRFLSHEVKGNVRMVCDVPGGMTVPANRNKLIQVLVNLVQNSVDALAHKSFTEDEPTIWIEGRTENGKTLLSIRDNGEGIDSENLNKVFDPFFTTKDVGEGMGLGLSICYRIVQEFEGRILVRSERGRFCEFCIEFPDPDSKTVSTVQIA